MHKSIYQHGDSKQDNKGECVKNAMEGKKIMLMLATIATQTHKRSPSFRVKLGILLFMHSLLLCIRVTITLL